MKSRMATVGLPILGGLVLFGAWWGGAELFDVATLLVPTPPQVLDAFLLLPGYMLQQTWVTLLEVLLGFGLSIAVGLLIGLALAGSRVLKQMFYPLLVGLNAIPKLAFASLFLVWFGFDKTPKIVMVLLLCFFPIVLSTAYGLTSTPVEYVDYARSLGTPRWRVFAKVRFPYALPQIFVGLKVAITLAVIGATVGELLGGSNGLGYVIQSSGANSNTALSFAAIILLAVMGAVLFLAVAAVERVAIPWAHEVTAG